jgi:hypothetical protein
VLEAERTALEGVIFREAAEETATRSAAVPGDPADTTDRVHDPAEAAAHRAWALGAEVVGVAAADAGSPAHREQEFLGVVR